MHTIHPQCNAQRQGGAIHSWKKWIVDGGEMSSRKILGNKKLMYQETIKSKEKHCDVSLWSLISQVTGGWTTYCLISS